jgi:hypothetical protein
MGNASLAVKYGDAAHGRCTIIMQPRKRTLLDLDRKAFDIEAPYDRACLELTVLVGTLPQGSAASLSAWILVLH